MCGGAHPELHRFTRPGSGPRTRDWRAYDARREAHRSYDPADVYEGLVQAELSNWPYVRQIVPAHAQRDRRRQAQVERMERTAARTRERLAGNAPSRSD